MIAIAAALAALLLMCWILFTLAIYALPFFVAVSAGMFAYQSGAGGVGAGMVALLAGVVALVIGQSLFAAARSPAIRATIAAAYVAPAAFAGYHAVHGLAAIGLPSPGWHELLSITGALVIGFVTWSRMGALAGATRSGHRGHTATRRTFGRTDPADPADLRRGCVSGGRAGRRHAESRLGFER